MDPFPNPIHRGDGHAADATCEPDDTTGERDVQLQIAFLEAST